MPLRAEQALADDRGVAEGAAAVAQRLVERLGGRASRHRGVLSRVLPRARVKGQRPPVVDQQGLEPGAGVGLKRGQDLVELNRLGGLGQRQRVAVVQERRGGGAGREVDEEVALQEDARADLQRGVAVQRQSLRAELHRHDRGVAARLAVDAGDLADVDAGDPDGRVLADRVRRGEYGVHAEPVRERDVLGEPEVDEQRDDQQGQRAYAQCTARDLCLGEPPAGGLGARGRRHPEGLGSVVWSCVVPRLPGTLPIT